MALKRKTTKAKALKLGAGILLIVGLLSIKRGEAVLRDDARPPVVYLRSFKDEEIESAALHRFKNFGLHKAMLADTVPNNGVQEQDALGYVFRKIGPYIALGRPNEELPELGSSKLYVPNNEWQDTVRDLLNRSRLVIFRAGITDSLKWELAEIVRTVKPRQLLAILPVRESDYVSFIRWANSIVPVPLPATSPCSRLVKFDDTWTPSFLRRGRTLTQSLLEFFEQNEIIITETYWEKIIEHNGLRW
jgi:hypothetical protein